MRITYKVCCEYMSLFYSFLARGIHESAYGDVYRDVLCVYEIGKVTKPKVEGSPLFVFSNREAAGRYVQESRGSKLVVLQGIAENPRLPDRDRLPSAYSFHKAGLFREYWSIPVDSNLLRYDEWPVPEDTLVCDAFTPEKAYRYKGTTAFKIRRKL